MRALKKIVVTGGFGGLGAALAMGSGAFACSPQAGVTIVDANQKPVADGSLHAGDVVQVSVNTNTPVEKAGHVTLKLVNGPLFGVHTEYLYDTPAMIAPKFIATITLPRDLSTTVGSAWGATVDGQPIALPVSDSKAAEFFVLPPLDQGSSATTAPITSPPVTNPPPKAPPGPVLPGETIPAPKNVAAPLGNSRRAVTVPTAQPTAPAAQAAQVAPTAEAKKPDIRTGVPAVGSVAAPLVAGPAVAVEPVAAPADLWSGLTSTDQAPSLLDQAAPQRHGGGIPVGAILFGSGLIALAGVALATGRRQLAHSHIVRR